MLHDLASQAEHLCVAEGGSAPKTVRARKPSAQPPPASKFGSGIWGAGFGLRLGVWNVVGVERCTPKDVTDAVGTAVQLEHMRLVVSLARGGSMKGCVPTDCWTRSGRMDGPGTPTLIELPLDVHSDRWLIEDILHTSSHKAPLIQFWRGKEMLEIAAGEREQGNTCLQAMISHVSSAVGATGAPNGIRVLREFLAGRLPASGA